MDCRWIKNYIKAQKIFYAPFKKYYYLRYIKKYAQMRRHIPQTFYIETTNFCNAQCKMCPHQRLRREKMHMPWELFAKIIDECQYLAKNGLHIILHKDGEPLLDPLLFERIRYVKEKIPQAHVHFNSNAMLLDRACAYKILHSGLNSITFSVDGASSQTYERLRVGLKYEVVKQNIERFFELKQNNANTTHVTMQMVVCPENKHEIEAYKQLWLGRADTVYLKAMHSFLDMGTSLKTTRLSSRQIGFCEEPYRFMFIYCNGDVGLCCWDYNNEAQLGNVKENRLIDIFNNEKFSLIRAAMNKMDCSSIIPCNRCNMIYGRDAYLYFSWEREFRSTKSLGFKIRANST